MSAAAAAVAVSRAEIVAAARSYMGVRWHHQGRTRAGIDCIGLVIAVARDLGLSTYDITGYSRTPDGVALRRVMAEQLVRVDHMRPGAVLLFSFFGSPLHAAIVTEPGNMVHAFANARRVVEHRIDAVWRQRLFSVFDYPGVD